MVATNLFFSEYVEGSSLNKALEIANFTGDTVDLSEYTIAIYFNGSTSAGTTIPLSGTLADGEVFVVADDGADAAILAVADLTTTSSLFNGDDAIALVKNGAVVDVFGQIGVDPGSSWPGGGADVTLRRLSSVTAGDTDGSDAFDASVEWESFPQNTFDGLGSHTIDGGVTPPPAVLINEIQVSTSGSDWEFFELQGTPGTDLSNFTLLVIESDSGTTTGTIDTVISLAGQTIPDDGFWLGSTPEADTAYGVTGDLSFTTNAFENSSATYLLVKGFTGAQGDDLDTDDDGVLDITPWTAILDGLTLTDGGAADVAYSDVVIGPDGSFLPSGTFRSPNAPTGSFSNDNILNFSTPDGTPGVSNVSQPLVINEVLVSTTSTDVEFIEIFGEPGTSLAGLSVLNIEGGTGAGSIDNRFDLPGDAVIGDNGFYLIGNSLVAGALGVTPNAEIPGNFFENSSSTIALVETATITGTSASGNETVIDAVALQDSGGGTFFYGAPVLGPDGSFYPSAVTRTPDGGAFQLVDAFSPAGANTTPTAGTGTEPPPPTEITKIHTIQGETNLADGTLVGVAGAADESPLLGNAVSLQGVVTKVLPDLGGFYVQEEDTDADTSAFSSEGIFVASAELVTLGNIVTVGGTVAEVEGETRINASSVAIDNAGDNSNLVTPVTIEFPTATVLRDADGDFVANLEAYEGMVVTIPEAMSVTELFQLDRFGTIRLSSEGRLEQFTQGNAPSQAGFEQHLKGNAARSLIIDDGQDIQNPTPILVPDLGNDGTLDNGDVFRMGDTYTGLTGVLSYSEDDQTGSEEPEYRLHTPTGTLNQVNARPTSPADVGGSLKVASFNVLNFFTTLDTFPGNEGVGPNDLSPRGADTNPQNAVPGVDPLDEYNRQLAKLVEALVDTDADVVGLVELENDFLKGGESPNDASAQDPRDVAIQELVNAVNAKLGTDVYDWVHPVDENGNPVEFVGGDAIAVGFIYNTTTVNLTGDAAILDEPSFLDPNGTGQGRNRAALAQTFEEASTGEKFTAAINHFKSKGSSGLDGDPLSNPDVDQLDGQGFWNDTRTDAAIALADWLATDPTESGDADFLILGDLNAYASEAPIQALIQAGYTDLAQQFIGEESYSFVFDGQTGTLDYALANSALFSQVTGATEWHINADEPDAFDYNLEFGRDPGLFNGADSFRSSDHDPVIVGLNLASPNEGPVAVDDTVTTPEDAAIAINVLVNDSDPDGDGLALKSFDVSGTSGLVTQKDDGTLNYDPNGFFTYLAAGETATDSFSYVISDGELTDSATVTITIEGPSGLTNSGSPFSFSQGTNGGANRFGFDGDAFSIAGQGVRGRHKFQDFDDFLVKAAEVFDGGVERTGTINDQRLAVGEGPNILEVNANNEVIIGGRGISGFYQIQFEGTNEANNFRDFADRMFDKIDNNDAIATDPVDFRFDDPLTGVRIFFDDVNGQFGFTDDRGITQNRFDTLEISVEELAISVFGGVQLRDGSFNSSGIADGKTPSVSVRAIDDVVISGSSVGGQFKFAFINGATANGFANAIDELFTQINETNAIAAGDL